MPDPETPEPQTLAVPLNPDGSIGTLPEPLQKLFDARIRDVTQRAKAKAPDPVDAERLKTLEAENEQFRIKDAEAGKRYEDAIKIRDERETKERDRLQGELTRRTERLAQAARTDIKAEALRLGAREESLDELVTLLGARVTLNDALDVVVEGADSIAALVAGYLESKPHHKKAAGGQPMGLTGGATRQQGTPGLSGTGDIAAIHGRVALQGRLTGKDLADLAAARAGGRA